MCLVMTSPLSFDLPDIPVQAIKDPVLDAAGVSLSILRTDLVHPVISGNKWFKLKHNLISARQKGKKTLLSFGGAWSNHLHALAHAGRIFDFCTVGVIRGELPTTLNPCLVEAQEAGMILHPVDRITYRNKDSTLISLLKELYGDFHLIPEGGGNLEGAMGCAEIASLYSENDFDLVTLACGTGTTLAGLASVSCLPILGFQVLKGDGYLAEEVRQFLTKTSLKATCEWTINDEYHVGGYAKTNDKFMAFLTEFESRHGIPLEPVYSGKLLYGIFALAKKRDFFPQKCSILAIHGGGLQGRRGYIN